MILVVVIDVLVTINQHASPWNPSSVIITNQKETLKLSLLSVYIEPLALPDALRFALLFSFVLLSSLNSNR